MNAKPPRNGVMIVADVMTREPVTVRPDTPVAEVLELFDRHDFNAFPVVQADGTLAGIVTKLDVLRAIRPDIAFRIAEPDVIAARPVRDIMRSAVVNVEAKEPLTRATELMVSTRLRSLPVIRRAGGTSQLIGIVTQGDVLRAFQWQVHDAVAG